MNKIIEKTRYEKVVGEHIWEIDVFHGENEGLVVAEVELKSESEKLSIPSWVQEEVTGELKYLNSNLLKHPYKKWQNGTE